MGEGAELGPEWEAHPWMGSKEHRLVPLSRLRVPSSWLDFPLGTGWAQVCAPTASVPAFHLDRLPLVLC